MRVLVLVAIVAATAGCGKKCKEYDPGDGCDLVFSCCNEEETDCHFEARDETVFECAGGAGNCRDATEDMLCYVCGDGVRSVLDCNNRQLGNGGGGGVTCNDGTKSTCSTCTEDCCTEHGGCEP